jgi:hypothetical protein
MKSAIATALILGTSMAAMAHLGRITAPAAGASIAPGTTVVVRWTVPVQHSTIELAYSQDGSTWTKITSLESKTQNNYSWAVPANMKASTTTRLRVCQRSSGTCSNDPALNISHLDRDTLGVYTAVTGNFTISGTTGLQANTLPFSGAKVHLDERTRTVNISFEILNAGRVNLIAFDTKGQLLDVLLDEWKSKGSHILSVPSRRLDASKPIVFRLQSGDQVLQEILEVLP